MQEVNRLLDIIVTRTLDINRKNASGDALLDIDLAKDDIRQLYRRLELLRGIISERARMESAPGGSSQEEAAKSQGTAHQGQSTATDQPERAPLSETSHTREPAGIRDPHVAPNAPDIAGEGPGSDSPEQGSGASSKEAGPTRQEEHPAQPEKRHEVPTPESKKPSAQEAKPEPPEPAPQADPRADQQQNPPAAPQASEKEAPQEQKAQTPAPPKSKNNNGNRAVIDILAEYSDRTIGDAYLKEQDDSLHKRISGEEEDKSIGERMQKQPIANLKDAIGVNEKFLFINELFEGNIQDYQEAIAKLNDMEDARAAFDYLNTLGVEYAWDGSRSADTIEKLARLVQRRHL